MTAIMTYIKFLDENIQAIMPKYETKFAAGVDLRSTESLLIAPHGFRTISTGIAIELPVGFEAQIRPRSGLAAKYGVTVLNSPGTIDSDYRGEIKVILINHGYEDFPIRSGDRIAQLVISPIVQTQFMQTKHLSVSDRGEGGLGSTGVK